MGTMRSKFHLEELKTVEGLEFSLNIFIFFSEEHIQTENRKYGIMNNIMKKKRMRKQVQNTCTSSSR